MRFVYHPFQGILRMLSIFREESLISVSRLSCFSAGSIPLTTFSIYRTCANHLSPCQGILHLDKKVYQVRITYLVFQRDLTLNNLTLIKWIIFPKISRNRFDRSQGVICWLIFCSISGAKNQQVLNLYHPKNNAKLQLN